MATAGVEPAVREQTGFYCSTSGTYFSDKESLSEHYKSDFHRYNLKRKVAGLPPVSREWFEARKAQLSSTTTTPHQKVWYDPLTKKKFLSENTYRAHVNSKKYQDLVKQSGQPAPAPVITLKKLDTDAAPAGPTTAAAAAKASPAGYTITPLPSRSQPRRPAAAEQDSSGSEAEDDDADNDGWETASDNAAAGSDAGDEEEEGDWEEWDVCRSFFDNHVSSSTQDNLEYMYKKFGFYLPDAEYLVDPEGLLKYLGEKLQYGKVPLYTSGDDPNAKQFRSLHAVQRHMVDTNQCKLLYDNNEDEYAEFYDYSKHAADGEGGGDEVEEAGTSGKELIASDGAGGGVVALAGFELVLDGGNGGGKVLGSREFSKYYRQRPKPVETRESVMVNTVLAKYRALGIETGGAGRDVDEGLKRAQQKVQQREGRGRLNLAMRTNINRNLPKNVTF